MRRPIRLPAADILSAFTRNPGLLLIASFLYLVLANTVWILLDNRPPFWDMAAHQIGAVRILNSFAQDGLLAFRSIPGLTGYYPPLYHFVVAIFYSLFGVSPDVARFANLPATVLLFATTYGLGRTLLTPFAAAVAAILVNFYPIMVWVSREAFIDYWLASLVVLAIWVLIRTNDFANRRESIAFGVLCGLGLLTKQTFAMFVVLPAVWAARRNWKNAALAAVVAGVIAAYWYVPQWMPMQNFYAFNSSSGIVEGDPPRVSLQALVFYVRAMEGYQLFFPLFLVFIAGIICLARNFKPAWTPILLWIVGGWAGLMLMQNKDPKYTMPLLPAVALISATLFQARRRWFAALLPLLLFQHYLISFGIRQLPPAIVLAKGVDGPHSWHWNLYTQSYYGIWGPPDPRDWQIRRVLNRVTTDQKRQVRLGMIPDLRNFEAIAFEFEILVRGLPVVVNRLNALDVQTIQNNDYIVMSEHDQGFAMYYAPDLERVNRYILDRPQQFKLLERFSLPNGELIRLYEVVAGL